MLTYLFAKAKLDLETNYITTNGYPLTVQSAKQWCNSEWVATFDCRISASRTCSVHLISYPTLPAAIITYTSKLLFLCHYYLKPFKHIVRKCDYPELLI